MSKSTVNQPSRSNQEYVMVDGVKKRNIAYEGKSNITSKLRGEVPVDQLSPGKQKEKSLVAQLLKDRSLKKEFTVNGKKIVALDIDGVLANFNKAMQPYGTDKARSESAPEDYNFVQSGWFKNFDDFEKAHVTVMDKAENIPLNDATAPEAVNLLRKHGYDVIGVTARREEWRQGTLEFFKRNNIDIQDKDLHFSDKNNKTDTTHYDYILDDAPKNIVDALQNSEADAVIYNQPYNTHLDGKRVNTVLEYAQYIIDKDKNS